MGGVRSRAHRHPLALSAGEVLGFAVQERLQVKQFRRGQHPLDINDVWPENYSANSAQKVWAVKFAARHPNLALLDLSSFKCGHDAPTYGIVESMVTASGVPYAALHDIDANKPSGSIKIRVKTYAHTLMLLREKLEDQATKKGELDRALTTKKLELMKSLQQKLATVGKTDDKLDREVVALDAQVAEWQAQDDGRSNSGGRAKRAAGLNVIKDGASTGARVTAQKVD